MTGSSEPPYHIMSNAYFLFRQGAGRAKIVYHCMISIPFLVAVITA
jgi:hypothetical protein